MTPLRRATALIAVLFLVLSACSSGASRQVARVGDVVITERDLADLYTADSLPVDDQLRSTVFALIAREILVDAMVTEFGAGLDETKVQEVYDGFIAQMEASNLTPEDFLRYPGASLGMIRFDAEIAVVRTSVVESLVAQPGYLDALFEDPVGITTVCAKHILVATEDEANSVRARLDAGEDFAAIADELSLDTATPGGELGCHLASLYVEPFGSTAVNAPIGELTGPFESTFGWHLLIVSERTAPTREEIAADPIGELPSDELSSLWGGWFTGLLQVATVELDPKYGTWSPTGIVAPES